MWDGAKKSCTNPEKARVVEDFDHFPQHAEETAQRWTDTAMNDICDYCSVAKAEIFCRADSARLCLACDAQVRLLPDGGGEGAK